MGIGTYTIVQKYPRTYCLGQWYITKVIEEPEHYVSAHFMVQ